MMFYWDFFVVLDVCVLWWCWLLCNVRYVLVVWMYVWCVCVGYWWVLGWCG